MDSFNSGPTLPRNELVTLRANVQHLENAEGSDAVAFINNFSSSASSSSKPNSHQTKPLRHGSTRKTIDTVHLGAIDTTRLDKK